MYSDVFCELAKGGVDNSEASIVDRPLDRLVDVAARGRRDSERGKQQAVSLLGCSEEQDTACGTQAAWYNGRNARKLI